MNSIRTLLVSDPLAAAHAELSYRRGWRHFSTFLSAEVIDLWPRALSRFVDSPPWKYWDFGVVKSSLEILENSPDRTILALAPWSRQIGVGFDNLFRPSPTAAHEEGLKENSPQDLIRLATEFHPEYLRCVEHIFANLLTLYWAVLRKGGVNGKYNVPGAVSLVESRGYALLLNGYDDKIRNAVAHGEVVFTGSGIQYGDPLGKYELGTLEFLSKFDTLWRTSNSLAIALLLFVARHKDSFESLDAPILPPSILAFLVSGSVERPGLALLGAVESELPRTGKQLHIAFRTTFKSRELVLLDVARLALRFLENGASSYQRYLFDIDYGESIPSLVTLSPERLNLLLQEDASIERFSEIFDDTPLLWYNDSALRSRVKAWKILLSSSARLARENFLDEWQKAGFSLGIGRYLIREVKNASVKGIGRIDITAVLRNPSDADDILKVREIIRTIIRNASKQWVNTNPSKLEGRWKRFRRPTYVWVRLYRIDGTLRWLGSGGWARGNLLATAERIYGKNPPIHINNPEEVWKGIRLRYSIDAEEAAKVSGDLSRLIKEIQERSEGGNRNE